MKKRKPGKPAKRKKPHWKAAVHKAEASSRRMDREYRAIVGDPK